MGPPSAITEINWVRKQAGKRVSFLGKDRIYGEWHGSLGRERRGVASQGYKSLLGRRWRAAGLLCACEGLPISSRSPKGAQAPL